MTRRWLLVALLALLTSSAAIAASEYQSKVVRALAGIEVLHSQHPERIRLSGIDRGFEVFEPTRSGAPVKVPEVLRRRLWDHCQMSNDPDKRQRGESAFDGTQPAT